MIENHDDDRLLRSVSLQNAESIRLVRQRAEREAEAALREQAHLLDLTHDSIYVCDGTGAITYWNRAAEELYGWTREQATGRLAHELLNTVFPLSRQHSEDEVVRTGRWEGELRQTKKNGADVIVASRWSLRRDDDGAPIAVLKTNNDITERTRAEALLAGEKRILEMVAKGEPLAQILDTLCRLVEAQAPAVLASVLLSDGEHLRHGGAPSLPKAFTDAIDGAPIGPSAGSCGTAAYRGQQVIVEDIATDPLWASYRDLALPHSLRACWSTPVFSSEGAVIATFAMYYREPRSPSLREQEIIAQITHLAGIAIGHKLTQDRLRRSQSYLAEAEKLSHTGSWAYDLVGTLFYWSEENLRMWGFDPQHGLPDYDEVVRRIHPEDRDRVLQGARTAIADRRDYVVEYRIIPAEGTIRHLRGMGHPVFGASGQVVEVIGTNLDVTDRKRAEEERERLRQLEADLARINRVTTLGELAASLAHEIRQPIAAAVMDASACVLWLGRDVPDLGEASAAAAQMARDATRAAEIIDHVHSLYRHGMPQREIVDVNEIIGEMRMLLKHEAGRHGVAIRSALATGLPSVLADRVQVQQVLMNLMLNGIEAMKDTAGELMIRSKPAENGLVLISVSDSGVGLPVDQADRIFDVFFTTKSHGTGMGLSISRTIVEAHGGRLWASANSDRGTTFHFTLSNDLTAPSPAVVDEKELGAHPDAPMASEDSPSRPPSPS